VVSVSRISTEGGEGRFLKALDTCIVGVGVAMVLYHLASTQYLFVGPTDHQAIHLCFSLLLVFLVSMRATKRRTLRLVTLVLLVSILVVAVYIGVYQDYLGWYFGVINPTAIVMGILLVIVVIEGTRRAWGPVLPIVAGVFILYAFLGHLVPGPVWHHYIPPVTVLCWLGIGLEGIFGNVLSASANYIFLFVVFGALLEVTGATQFFLQVGIAAGRVLAGGAAQTAVVSSALVGMVTGSAMGNVALTGAFTIPLMKKMGYTPETAGAVEAVASTGGQLMPPIMGAAAFMMAGITGVPYVRIMVAAVIPALLYYLGVGLGVQVIAYKQRIGRTTEKVDTRMLIRRGPLFVIPLIVIIILLVQQRSPMYAAFYGIVSLMILSFIQKETRPSWGGMAQGLGKGAVAGANIGVACACVGMSAKVISVTGLGQKAAGIVTGMAGEYLIIALMLTMLISIILGIGVPTIAAYILVAVVVAPVLVNMGVGLIPAHLFCFYFAIVAAVTPPVALAVIAAAGIAGGQYFKTGWAAIKLSFVMFILPYLIVFNPVMVLELEEPVYAALSLISIVASIVAMVAAVYGYLGGPLGILGRSLFALAAIALLGYAFAEVYLLFAVGMVGFILLMLWQWRRRRTVREVTSAEP